MIKKIKDYLVKIEKIITSLLLLMVIVDVFISVCSRYLFHFPLFWADELARMSFIWMIMFGSVVGVEENTHFRMDYFYNKLPKRAAKIVFAISLFFISAFLIVLCWQGIVLCQNIVGVKSAGLGIPMYIFYLAIPIGAFLMLIQLFLSVNK